MRDLETLEITAQEPADTVPWYTDHSSGTRLIDIPWLAIVTVCAVFLCVTIIFLTADVNAMSYIACYKIYLPF